MHEAPRPRPFSPQATCVVPSSSSQHSVEVKQKPTTATLHLLSTLSLQLSPFAAAPSAPGNKNSANVAFGGKSDTVGEQVVANADALMRLFNAGNNQRKVGGTKMNAESSRSHSIFSVLLEVCNCAASERNGGKIQRDLYSTETEVRYMCLCN